METDNDLHPYIARLERELDEMTHALSHAWDQLVPFLQDAPPPGDTLQDMTPFLEAVRAAADTDNAAVYLFQGEAWHAVPEVPPPAATLRTSLRALRTAQALAAEADAALHWAFAPILSEGAVIGALGIGVQDEARAFSAVDLRILTRMAERISSQMEAAQLARYREQEAVHQRELQIARQIQQSVQPHQPPTDPRFRIASYWQPAKEVGGDAWGWVAQGEDRLAWFILDVAGKGLPAALAAVALHTAISMTLRLRLSPAAVLRLVNEAFYDAYTRTDLMATAAILSLNTRSGAFELANAGHPPVLVRHHNKWLRLEASTPPIGVLPTLQSDPQVLMLQPDDLVIAYSDGFTEIETSLGLWGESGLLSTIPAGARDVAALARHIAAAAAHVGAASDDQTLIAAIYQRE